MSLPNSYTGSTLVGEPDGEATVSFYFSNVAEAEKWFAGITGDGRGECEVCGGSGIDPEPRIYPVCCNRPTPGGECCGNPRPEQEPQACRECTRPSATPPQQEQAAPIPKKKYHAGDGLIFDGEKWLEVAPGMEVFAMLNMAKGFSIEGKKAAPGAVPDGFVMVDALRDLYKAYVRLLQSGKDRIETYGGTCDPVDVMEESDPELRKVRAMIAAAPKEPGA